jgi:SAM-dependent methyltransferase
VYDRRTALIYDLLYSGDARHAPIRDVAAEADRILMEIRRATPAARSLLDVGCGTGRHVPYLARELTVHGLDTNSALLEVARARSPQATFHQADMVDFRIDGRFDAVICMFSAIAYVVDEERLRRAVLRFVEHLSPGGVVIIEPWFTPESFWDGHVSADCRATDEVTVAWLYRQERDGEVSTMDMHYLVATKEGVEHYRERHELGLFTHATYAAAMSEAGLRVSHDPQGFGRGLYIGVVPR